MHAQWRNAAWRCVLVGLWCGVAMPQVPVLGLVLHDEDFPPIGIETPAPEAAVSFGNAITTTPIAPNFLITAAHWKNDASLGQWLGGRVRAGQGGFTHEVVDFRLDRTLDLIIFRIEPLAGQPTGLSMWVDLYNSPDELGQEFAVGSYGPDNLGNRGTLHWGKNVVSSATYFFNPATGLRAGGLGANFDPIGQGDYVKFESKAIVGDSGSGGYINDGLQWKLGVVTQNGGGISGPRISLHTAWIDQQIADMGGTRPPPTLSIPVPDAQWTGASSSNWFDNPNWIGGIPTASSLARVDAMQGSAAAEASITSPGPTAQANALHIGVEQSGDLTQTDGSLNVSDSVYLGIKSNGKGIYSLSGNGSLSARKLYIGYKGEGEVVQSGGVATVSDTVYVGKEQGGVGRYELSGGIDTLLSTDRLVVGANGFGRFQHFPGRVETRELIVSETFDFDPVFPSRVPQYDLQNGSLSVRENAYIGFDGGATFTQFGINSRVTINNDLYIGFRDGAGGSYIQISGTTRIDGNLYLGYGETSQGSYSMSNGELFTGNVFVGVDGTGQFNQSGGTHETGFVKVNEGSLYKLSSGVLKVANSFDPGSGFDFDGGDATLDATGLINLAKTNLQNAGNATIHIRPDSLIILPAGFDPDTQLGSFISEGLVANADSTIHIQAGQGFTGHGRIDQPVIAQGSIQASPGNGLHLADGLEVSMGADVDLGISGSLTVNDTRSHISSGQLEVGIEHIGTTSTAFFHQSGGTHTVDSLNVGLGGSDSVEGVYLLSGGSLQTRWTRLSGPSQFIQTGGTHTVGTIRVSFGSTYEYLGGTLTTTGTSIAAGIDLFGGRFIIGPTQPLTATGSDPAPLALTVSSIHNETGTIDVNPGTTLHVINAFANTFGGTINVDQATLQFDSGLTTGAFGAAIHLIDSTLTGNLTLRRGSLITATGSSQINGQIIDSSIPYPMFGRFTFNIDGELDFNGPVNTAASFTGTGTAKFNNQYNPGNTFGAIGFEGGVAFGAAATFGVDLFDSGGVAGTDFDQINVTGGVALGGTLDIALMSGFSPDYYEEFDILTAGTRSGKFATVTGAFINPDMTLAPVYDYEGDVGLTLIAAIPGDANLDGIVNGQDLLTWQANLFSGDQWVQGDFNLDGLVSGLDLLIWQSHLFNTVQGLGGGAAALAAGAPAVPEPSSLAALGVVGCLAFCRRRCHTDQ